MVRNILIRLSYKLAKFIGGLHLPYSRKRMVYSDCKMISDIAKPGDIILSRTLGEASNLFIGGYFKHAAIYIGNDRVVEAIGSGVRNVSLVDFVMSKDDIGLFRPMFATPEQADRAALFALQMVGSRYDYEFRGGNEAFYCSELVTEAYISAMDGKSPFDFRLRYGKMTVIPNDIAMATTKFKRVI